MIKVLSYPVKRESLSHHFEVFFCYTVMKGLLLRMKTKGPFGFCSGGAINHGTVALPRQLAETQVSQKEQSESKIAERSGFDGQGAPVALTISFFSGP